MAITYKEEALPAVSTFAFDINRWAGLNKIKGSQYDYEMADCKNMSSDNFPYASPRKPRELIYAEEGIKRIYKVEDGKIYFIDPEDYLCYAENSVKSYITYTDDEGTEQKVRMPECKCTNNYDKCSIFYPNIRYIDENNDVSSVKQSIEFGSILGPVTSISPNGNRSYRVEINSTLYIDNIDATNFKISVKFPSEDDLEFPYSSTWESRFDLILIRYDKNNNSRESRTIIWYETDEREKYWVVTFSDFEEGDYLFIRCKYSSSDEDDVTESFCKQVFNFVKSGEWTIVENAVDGFSNGNPFAQSLDYGVVYNNRIVGVKGNNIRASALGDFTNFTEYADEAGNASATGAYATDVGSSGDFTGICAYNNVLLLFKKDIVYEMYGSMPYTITELCNTGCIDNDSICSIDGVLYWASPKGIVRYSGGMPSVISAQTDICTDSVCKAGTDGRKYYVYDGHKNFVYDTYYQMWHIEDENAVKMRYNHINDLYMVCDDGIYKADSGNENVEWEFETKDYTFTSKERKNLSKLWIRADMAQNSKLEIYVRQNGGEWSRAAVKTAERDEMFDFKLRVKKCDSYTLKFKGKGDVRILDIHGKVTVGTSKHRSGNSLNVYRK